MQKDGEPAVCVTPYADIAIFRSLVHSKNLVEESRSNFGIKNNQLYFGATENLIHNAKHQIGYVHILYKKDFYKFNGIEYRSVQTHTPFKIIEVGYNDLPQNIEIIYD